MKKRILLVAVALLALVSQVNATTWTNDPQHSRLGFVVKHLMISKVSGRFADFTASVTTSKADYSDAKITLTAQTKSVDTDVDARDNHLRSADFFDVEKYPTMTFKSTSIKKTSAKTGIVSGLLTFHGITKSVKLNVTFFGKVVNPMNKKTTAGFQVTGIVKRSDYNLGASFPEAMIANDIHIVADVEFSPEK